MTITRRTAVVVDGSAVVVGPVVGGAVVSDGSFAAAAGVADDSTAVDVAGGEALFVLVQAAKDRIAEAVSSRPANHPREAR